MSINLPLKLNLDENKIKYGVFRLDIYHKPGWFRVQVFDNERDADIYCDMLNLDTNMIHSVFYFEEENEVH